MVDRNMVTIKLAELEAYRERASSHGLASFDALACGSRRFAPIRQRNRKGADGYGRT